MKGFSAGAAAALAAFALAATIALAADLGRADAAAQFAAQGPPVLSVYSPADTGAPKLDEKTISEWRSLDGVRVAVAVREQPITLSGLDYALPATVYAIPEAELKTLSLHLIVGEMPRSAWNPQVLLGSAMAQKLADAAKQAGGALPGTVRLAVEGGGTMVVQVSGVATTTDTARDDGLWLDDAVARSLLPTDDERKDAEPLPITRAEVEARSASAAASVAQALRTQGYLVRNAAEAPAHTLADGAAMVRQWCWLSALLAVIAALALWRRPPQRALSGALVAVAVSLAGVAAGAVLMQTAELLGWRFFLSADARYLLDAPRLLAVPVLAAALTLAMGLLPRRAIPAQKA